MKQYESGISGEELAEKFLCQQGMALLARRFRGQGGEIDLIMQDGGCIVFVEVKYRPGSSSGSGLLAITPAKQKRIAFAAQYYLIENKLTECSARFDAVEITGDGILHIPNAFLFPL